MARTKREDKRLTALKNDYMEMISTFDPTVVEIRRQTPNPGSLALIEICVHAPSAYLAGSNDSDPIDAEETTFYMNVRRGYPRVAPQIYYEENRRLASPRVFSWGAQCIDWNENMSLNELADQVIRTIIYDPTLYRHDWTAVRGTANPAVKAWLHARIEASSGPTIDPGTLYADAVKVM